MNTEVSAVCMPRSEHPQPQMQRENWMNLNGEWDFEFDFGKSQTDRKLYEKNEGWEKKIIVPFCPESELSGIGYKDFIPMVWYHRTVELTKKQLSGKLFIHFGAVDYKCRVWVNGKEAGTHEGGYTSFSFDITKLAAEGINHITVSAEDDNRSGKQPRGKQCASYYSCGCDYTRTTGIWQTVWLEWMPTAYIKSVKYYPNLAQSELGMHVVTSAAGTFEATAKYQGEECGHVSIALLAGENTVNIPLSRLEKWEPGNGRLYDLELKFDDDAVNSYFGMRQICIEGEKVLINGKSVFQRLVLDQGFYPDGIYTAPTDEALAKDIELSMAAGFNGARLHQKVFEARFLYHCDRLGYMVWGEQGNWGLDHSSEDALKHFLPEWMEAVERDFNHPAIVGWCPFNETWDYEGRRQDNSLLANVYKMTKMFDKTRPCIDTSGNYHVITDIYDVHDYEQDPEKFAQAYRPFAEGGDMYERFPDRQTPIKGIPTFISEYGGIKWDEDGTQSNGWGYGKGPKTKEELIERYKGLTDSLLDNPHMFAFCYTQLYDVEQELNGLYTYNRKPKFDMEVFKAINSRKAAIEE